MSDYPINPELGVPSGISDKVRDKLGKKARQKVHNDHAWLAEPLKPSELRGSKMKA